MKHERRDYSDSTLELRGMLGAGAVLAGHAAVFDQEAILWGFREQVAPRAFKKSIKESDVRALFNHDPNHVLGRNKAGTLRLAEDSVGLAYEIELPDTQFAQDLARSIERGDISQSSFAFEVVAGGEKWSYPEKGSNELPLRTIREVKLFDISPVTYPAYEGTDVDIQRALRSLAIDLDRPLDELVSAAREGRLIATTFEPEEEPGDAPLHTEPDDAPLQTTREPDWQARARRTLALLR
jgi:HK97 family phage prohead protease